MNGHSHRPMTAEEVTAAREKAAGDSVSWNRTRAVREAIEAQKAKAAKLAAETRSRRIRSTVLSAAFLMLLLLAWMWARRH